MNQSSGANKAEWYCKISDEELGPLTTEDLLGCLKDGAVNPETLVKKSSGGKWIKIETVSCLFSGTHEDETSTVSAASEALSGIDAKRAAVFKNEGMSSPVKQNQSQESREIDFSTVFHIPELVIEYLADKLSFLGYLFKLWIIIPLLLVGTSVLFIEYYVTPWSYQKNAYEQYQTIWNDLKQLRSQKASDEEWEKFQKASSIELNKTIASLEKSASVKNQEQLILLRIGRDYLSEMLEDPRMDLSRSEKQLEKQMQIIEMTRRYPENIPNNKSLHPVTFLMIVADVMIVLGCVLFFLFRRRSY